MAKKVKKISKDDKKHLHQKFGEELKELKDRIESWNPIENKKINNFSELPITKSTIKALEESGFINVTEIQKQAIPECLRGSDILGAAKTGSGKTLAFLIPVVERLIHESWNEMDGLGALIISPTRELSIQIYEVLLKVGKYSSLSAGLVIGGKDYQFEKERIGRVNILIGTPGRLLQHMDESATLKTENLQILVLDEADRILDMGFKKTIDSILDNLPTSRQTMLFSATQTKSVSDLARLSLLNPKYINSSSDQKSSTPESLEQSYVVTPLFDKLNILWSFIRAHLESKILVFASSSKQVHFIYECFRKLQPGIPLMKLHGRQKQKARLETTVKFTQSKNCCLFATDVVARGLDFPAIDWVIQLDCPEDVSTYIHRVGRSARFGRVGKSMLILTPTEEQPFLKLLEAKKIEPKRLNIKGSKKKNIQNQLQSLCFKSPELKYLGQKAFISYCKSVFIQKNKEVFNLDELPLDKFATSYGLPGMPKIKLQSKKTLTDEDLLKFKEKKNASRKLKQLENANEDGEIEQDKRVRTKYDKMFERTNQDVLSEHYNKINGITNGKDDDVDDDDDEFLTVKRQDNEILTEDLPDLAINTSKRAIKQALSKRLTAKKGEKGTKIVFDDDGESHPAYELDDEEAFLKEGPADELKKEFLINEQEIMSKEDGVDKDVAKEKRDEKKRKRKELERLVLQGSGHGDNDGLTIASLVSDNAEDGEQDIDLDRDLQSSSDDDEGGDDEDEEPDSKRLKKWFESDNYKNRDKKASDGIIEIEQPETIDDLEALTERLLNE